MRHVARELTTYLEQPGRDALALARARARVLRAYLGSPQARGALSFRNVGGSIPLGRCNSHLPHPACASTAGGAVAKVGEKGVRPWS